VIGGGDENECLNLQFNISKRTLKVVRRERMLELGRGTATPR
jgi:hypothetical protein